MWWALLIHLCVFKLGLYTNKFLFIWFVNWLTDGLKKNKKINLLAAPRQHNVPLERPGVKVDFFFLLSHRDSSLYCRENSIPQLTRWLHTETAHRSRWRPSLRWWRWDHRRALSAEERNRQNEPSAAITELARRAVSVLNKKSYIMDHLTELNLKTKHARLTFSPSSLNLGSRLLQCPHHGA